MSALYLLPVRKPWCVAETVTFGLLEELLQVGYFQFLFFATLSIKRFFESHSSLGAIASKSIEVYEPKVNFL